MKGGEVKREAYWPQFSTNYPPLMNYRTKVYSTDSASKLDFILDNQGYCLRQSMRVWTRIDWTSLGSINPGFQEVCELSADLTALQGILTEQEGPSGNYWVLKFVVGIRFGGTELEAFIEWEKDVR